MKWNVPIERLTQIEYPEEFKDANAILDFGASKYDPNGWLQGIKFDHRSNMASVNRHLSAVCVDPMSKDPESELPHILHAAGRLLMEYTLMCRGNLKLSEDK